MAKITFVISDDAVADSVTIECPEFIVSAAEMNGPVPAALVIAMAIQELTSGEHNDMIDLLHKRRLITMRELITTTDETVDKPLLRVV